MRQLTINAAITSWVKVLRVHSKMHPYAAFGLFFSISTMLIFLIISISSLMGGSASQTFRWALLAGLAGLITTTVGALPAIFLKEIPQKLEDSLLGFAAGMMLAASAFSLIIPGIAAGEEIFSSKFIAAMIVVAGLGLGVMLMLGLDEFTPHEHDETGPCGPGHQGCSRVWLFVFAIALHNLPEGMAMGVSFSGGDTSVGLPLSTAIALQDIPEGLAVALSLRAIGIKALTAVAISAASGLLEPIGAILGVTLSSATVWTYPIGLGLAAGAMIFVVSHEVIPQTHHNGHQTMATIGLMIGFALMMVLDTTLG